MISCGVAPVWRSAATALAIRKELRSLSPVRVRACHGPRAGDGPPPSRRAGYPPTHSRRRAPPRDRLSGRHLKSVGSRRSLGQIPSGASGRSAPRRECCLWTWGSPCADSDCQQRERIPRKGRPRGECPQWQRAGPRLRQIREPVRAGDRRRSLDQHRSAGRTSLRSRRWAVDMSVASCGMNYKNMRYLVL